MFAVIRSGIGYIGGGMFAIGRKGISYIRENKVKSGGIGLVTLFLANIARDIIEDIKYDSHSYNSSRPAYHYEIEYVWNSEVIKNKKVLDGVIQNRLEILAHAYLCVSWTDGVQLKSEAAHKGSLYLDRVIQDIKLWVADFKAEMDRHKEPNANVERIEKIVVRIRALDRGGPFCTFRGKDKTTGLLEQVKYVVGHLISLRSPFFRPNSHAATIAEIENSLTEIKKRCGLN